MLYDLHAFYNVCLVYYLNEMDANCVCRFNEFFEEEIVNEKGEKLFNEVFSVQKKRIYNALLSSSSKEVINFNSVLNKIINEKI